jgi:hypothetical protein
LDAIRKIYVGGLNLGKTGHAIIRYTNNRRYLSKFYVPCDQP